MKKLALSKPIKRETQFKEVYGKYRNREVVVILEPSNELTFKIKGTSQSFTCHLADCYNLAKLREQERINKKRKADYTANKKAGKRVRKPKMINLFLNEKYTKAINETAKILPKNKYNNSSILVINGNVKPQNITA